MNDKKQFTTGMMKQTAYPTSPWTELYEAASQSTEHNTMSAAQSDFSDETQQPTRDALSVSYN